MRTGEQVSGYELLYRAEMAGVRIHLEDEDGRLTGKTEDISAADICICQEGEAGSVTFQDTSRKPFHGNVLFVRTLRNGGPDPFITGEFSLDPAVRALAAQKLADARAQDAFEAGIPVESVVANHSVHGDDILVDVSYPNTSFTRSVREAWPQGEAPINDHPVTENLVLEGDTVRQISADVHAAAVEAMLGVPGPDGEEPTDDFFDRVPAPFVEPGHTCQAEDRLHRVGVKKPRLVPLDIIDDRKPQMSDILSDLPQFEEINKLDDSVPEGFAAQVLKLVSDRGGQYGTPAENHQLTADLFQSWLSRRVGQHIDFDAECVVMFNIIQKVSRLAYTSKDDSWLDIAGYVENIAMLRPEQRQEAR